MLGVAAQVVGFWDESKRTLPLWGGSTTFMAPKAGRDGDMNDNARPPAPSNL